MTTIKLQGLRKVYGSDVVVEDTNLEFGSGDFIVLLGPSGCGKTTTLNMIAGFEAPTDGQVLFDGKSVNDLPPHARNVAMVFQSALLYPHLTALTNIQMSLRHAQLSSNEKAARISSATRLLKVDHLLAKKPAALSGGERQRVALAKAIVRQPSVFLMDEPFSALDAALRNALRAELVHLQKTLGVTTVFVTHDQVEAMTMGDVIVVMKDGRVEQVGSPDEIYNRPSTRFVAGFVGTPAMNFLEGVIEDNRGSLFLNTRSSRFRLPEWMRNRTGQRETSYWLGVRPQHMRISDALSESSIAGEVWAVERHGKENVAIVQTTDGSAMRILTAPDVALDVGEKLALTFDSEKAYLFSS
jgi:ABC-type sugar transport system ATPase subunit